MGNVKYYLGKLGPVERTSLVQEDGVRDEEDDDIEDENVGEEFNMFEFIEETKDWLFINTVESLLKRGKKVKETSEKSGSSKKSRKRVHPSAGIVQHLFEDY